MTGVSLPAFIYKYKRPINNPCSRTNQCKSNLNPFNPVECCDTPDGLKCKTKNECNKIIKNVTIESQKTALVDELMKSDDISQESLPPMLSKQDRNFGELSLSK